MLHSQSFFDRFAIGTSTLCAVHCAALPIIVTLFPALFSSAFNDEYFHIILVWLVVPASVIALTMGCKKHRDMKVLLLGAVSITGLISVAIFGHDFLGETGEKVATFFFSMLSVAAHLRNHSLCKDCHHH